MLEQWWEVVGTGVERRRRRNAKKILILVEEMEIWGSNFARMKKKMGKKINPNSS